MNNAEMAYNETVAVADAVGESIVVAAEATYANAVATRAAAEMAFRDAHTAADAVYQEAEAAALAMRDETEAIADEAEAALNMARDRTIAETEDKYISIYAAGRSMSSYRRETVLTMAVTERSLCPN